MKMSDDIYNVSYLASPKNRLFAVLIDLLLSISVTLLILKLLDNTKTIYEIIIEQKRCIYIINIFVFCLFNAKFLFYGQTVGKRIMKIQVRTKDGKVASFTRFFAIRILFCNMLYYLIYIPLNHYNYLNIVETLLIIGYMPIFTQSRRCWHDYVAGTIVTKFSKQSKLDIYP